MTATAPNLNHLAGRVLPQGARSISLDTSGQLSDRALVTITTRGRDAGPTVIDTGVPLADLAGQHVSFSGEVLTQGNGRIGALLRHTLTAGDTALLTAVFLHSGRIRGIYAEAPGTAVHRFDSADDHRTWVCDMLEQRDPIPAAA